MLLIVANMLNGVGRRSMYTIGVSGLLVAAGILAWRTWSHTSAGTFDPVSAVIGIASLVVSVASFGLAARAQRQADTDITAIAARLAVAVEQEETEARRQLLGDNNRAINVHFTFKPAPAHEAAGAGRTGTLEGVVTYYRRLKPGRMVVTGAAGSGKTVLAVELILSLLNNRPVDDPVPVRMSAASLDTNLPPQFAVTEWITRHLRQAYQMPDAAARELATARMVLPVLDGLDEMDADEAPAYASRAGKVIRACNVYLDGQQRAAIVLTCRIGQYEALEHAREWVHDAARVEVRPVEVQAARGFLTGRAIDAGRWQPVLHVMQEPGDPPLAKAMSTPWRLTLAAAVYDQRDPGTGAYLRDPAELITVAMDTEKKIRDHLLALYIPAAIVAYGSGYSVPQVQRTLRVLASYLNANTANPTQSPPAIAGRPLSGTDLVLHELWPLAGYRLPRIITAGMLGIFWTSLIAFLIYSAVITGSTLRSTFYIIFCVIGGVAQTAYGWNAWPTPTLLEPQKAWKTIRTGPGRGRASTAFAAVALIVGLAAGLAVTPAGSIAVALLAGLLAGYVAAAEVDPGEYSVAEPRKVVRGDFAGGLVAGLAIGLISGIAAGLLVGPAAGLGIGLMAGLLGTLFFGLVALRYLVLLLCTRRWKAHRLPWRLGRFMDWCYQAGLLRIAGIGYQFRHKEIQDFLAGR